jgi:hypothetical protein
MRHTHKPLLSANAFHRLALIQICHRLEENISNDSAMTIVKKLDVFEGIGKMDNPISLEIEENVKPIIDGPRRTPLAMKAKFKEMRNKLMKQEVIVKVDKQKAEATVKVAKLLIKKGQRNKEDIHLALRTQRYVPNKKCASPAQRLFSGRTRRSVPFPKEMLVPDVEDNVKEKIIQRRIGEPVYVKLKGPEDKRTKGVSDRQGKSRHTM